MPDIAVVTGAGQGIGLAVTRKILSDIGCTAIMVDKSASGRGAVAEFQGTGASANFIQCDISIESEVDKLVRMVNQLGRVRYLVNCAGIFRRGAATEVAFSEWMESLRINLGGAFLMSRSLAPAMLEGGRGAIVNITSDIAFHGAANASHYSASKGGLISLTRSLALEWAPKIRVNCVMPGVIDTEMPRMVGISEKELDERARRIPLGRIGKPEDVADVITFLLSQRAGYITGQTIGVNGGAAMI
jgi:3-oxoacyl-[acyl-carrier protein] reductase